MWWVSLSNRAFKVHGYTDRFISQRCPCKRRNADSRGARNTSKEKGKLDPCVRTEVESQPCSRRRSTSLPRNVDDLASFLLHGARNRPRLQREVRRKVFASASRLAWRRRHRPCCRTAFLSVRSSLHDRYGISNPFQNCYSFSRL